MAEEDLLAKLLEELLAADEKKDAPPPSGETGEKAENDPFGGIDLEAILKLGELFSEMNKPDRNTQLLLALKPHLRPENQSKVDSAMKIMKMMALLPIIRESGLLNGLF